MASSSSNNNSNSVSTGDKADGGRLADFDVSTITKEQLDDLDLRTLKDLAAELHMHKQGSKEELVARILKAQEIFKGKGKKRVADDNDNDNDDNDNDSEDVDDARITEPRTTDKESQLSQEELEKLREIIKKGASTGDKDSDKGMHKKRALSGDDMEISDDENKGDDDNDMFEESHGFVFPEHLKKLLPKDVYDCFITKDELRKANKNLALPEGLFVPPPILQEELKARLSKNSKKLDRELRTFTYKLFDILRPTTHFWVELHGALTAGQSEEDLDWMNKSMVDIIRRVYLAVSAITNMRRSLAAKEVNPRLEGAVKPNDSYLLAPTHLDKIKQAAKMNKILDQASNRPRPQFRRFNRGGFQRGGGRRFGYPRNWTNNFRGRGTWRPRGFQHQNNNKNKE